LVQIKEEELMKNKKIEQNKWLSHEKARLAAIDLVRKIAVIPDEGWFESTTSEIRREAKVIADEYVLAKCAAMISGASNLSDWAAIWSPDMPHIRLL
jgi:hypothetical protein